MAAAAAAARQLPDATTVSGSTGARRTFTLEELREKRAKVKEALDYMKALPSEAEIVQLAVTGLTRNDTDDARREAALEVLLEMAGLIDVANDFDTLGAIPPIVSQLQHPAPHIRSMAAHIIGTAAANNPTFASHATGHGAVPALLARLRADDTEPRVKALFALAQLVRAPGPALDAFAASGGMATLHELVVAPDEVHKLRLRAVCLLSDIALLSTQVAVLPAGNDAVNAFAGAIIRMMDAAAEADVVEKLLRAATQLMASTHPGRLMARALGAGGMDAAMESAWRRLDGADADASYRTELNALRDEVRGLIAAPTGAHDEL